MNESKLEHLQSVIDRLLYLNTKQLTNYIHELESLNSNYRIDMKIEEGVRIYSGISNLEELV
jgi:hypothetical protein